MHLKMGLLLLWCASICVFHSACKKEDDKEETTTATDDSDDDNTDEEEEDSSEDEATLQISQLLGTSIHRTSSSTPLAQSFTADEDFDLSQVSLYISNTNGMVAGSISLIITKGGATPTAGTRVSDWVTVTSSYSSGEAGWVEFEFSNVVSLTSGTTYWIEVWPASNAPFDLVEDPSAPYSGGQMLRMDSGSSSWVSSTESGQPALGDMKFKVYAAP